MGSTNKTTQVQLNQWIGSDILRREDFNYDKNVLDKQILLRNKAWQDNITLYADQWMQNGDKYVHPLHCTDEPGIRVDLSATIPNQLAVEAPLVIANENGNMFAETTNPPKCNICVQIALTYVLGAGAVVYGRALHKRISGDAYPSDNVIEFHAEANQEQIILRWEDPGDTTVDNITLAVWAGTKIVRKIGSFPDTDTDGVLVVDSTIRNEYLEDGFLDEGCNKGNTYCYQAFPYSTRGVVNRNVINRAEVAFI